MTEAILSSLPGTVLDDVTSHLARKMGIGPIQRGVLIVRVQPGSTVAEAGLRPGDVVEQVNGKTVASVFDLKHELQISPEPPHLLVNRYGVLLLKVLSSK